MSVTKRWQARIEAWESSRLTQTAYCQRLQLSKRSFTARLPEHRRQGKPSLPTSMPVAIETTGAVAKEAGAIQLCLAQGHRLEMPAAVSAQWLSLFLGGGWSDWRTFPSLVGGCAGGYAQGYRWPVDGRPGSVRTGPVFRDGVCVPGQGGEPFAVAGLGWQRRVAVPAAFAPGQFCLAEGG